MCHVTIVNTTSKTKAFRDVIALFPKRKTSRSWPDCGRCSPDAPESCACEGQSRIETVFGLVRVGEALSQFRVIDRALSRAFPIVVQDAFIKRQPKELDLSIRVG